MIRNAIPKVKKFFKRSLLYSEKENTVKLGMFFLKYPLTNLKIVVK